MGMFKPIVVPSLGVAALLAATPATSASEPLELYLAEMLYQEAWNKFAPGLQKLWGPEECYLELTECGAILFLNAGAFTVKSVQLRAHTTQPSGSAINELCNEIDKKFSADLTAGQSHGFIVPASCSYVLKVNIQSGPKKKRDIFLTPDCVVEARVEGAVFSNWWKKNVNWAKGRKPAGAGNTPKDDDGNKCEVS